MMSARICLVVLLVAIAAKNSEAFLPGFWIPLGLNLGPAPAPAGTAPAGGPPGGTAPTCNTATCCKMQCPAGDTCTAGTPPTCSTATNTAAQCLDSAATCSTCTTCGAACVTSQLCP